MVIPHEGSAIAPVPRPLADGIRARAAAQLSGTIEWGLAKPWSQQVR
jgi:hypothetical protein